MKVAILGMGNMGKAIYTKICDRHQVSVYDINQTGLPKEARLINPEQKENFDFIILSVKPKDIGKLKNLAWQGDIISIAAGVDHGFLSGVFSGRKIIRLMPNTPLLVDAGISGVFLDPEYTGEQKERARAFLEEFTAIVVVDKEELMDAITALSGCGPAYGFLFIEGLADGGVRCGLSRQDAYKLAASTLLGAAKMILETGKHPGELKDMVTSPAGSTIEGVALLEERGLRSSAMEAVTRAFLKTRNMLG